MPVASHGFYPAGVKKRSETCRIALLNLSASGARRLSKLEEGSFQVEVPK